jgi:glycosyltransferase involved in cell wall biosynthesis
MVCGSYPPDVCGVGDYTAQLIESLRQAGATAKVLSGMPWNWQSLRKMRKAIAQQSYDIVHIQYPSVGYGHSLIPQILSFCVPVVVTLHEFSHVRVLRTAASVPFLISGKRLVFTSRYELDHVRRIFPWVSSKSHVIPIGSNIQPIQDKRERDFNEFIYFGLIAPRKGIEQVLEFASVLKQERGAYKVRIIGRVPDQFREYALKLKAQASDLPVIWSSNLSDSEVAEHLARASIAYLPFPDGASERRGSLKALFSSGVACVSTAGKQTSTELQEVLEFASDSKDAAAKAIALTADRPAWELLSAKSLVYSASFRWDSIAQCHLDLYRGLIRERGHRS